MPLISKAKLNRIVPGSTKSLPHALEWLGQIRTKSFLSAKRFDIFLSHAFEDARDILTLYEALTMVGYEVFVDWMADPGSGLVTGDDRGVIELWKMPNGRESLELLTNDRADNVWFDPDGKTIRALSLDGTLAAWNLETHDQIASSHLYTKVSDAKFSSDLKYLAVNESNNVLHLLDSSAGEISRFALTVAPAGTHVSIKAISPTGKYVVVDGTPRGSGPIISQLDNLETSAGQRISRVVHEGLVWAVTFSSDEKLLVTGGRDGTARVWDASNGSLLKRIDVGSPVDFLSFTPDDKYLVTAQRWH